MNVLIIGSGAREHCLAWKIRQSPSVDELYCAPGNAGTALQAENVPLGTDDLEALADWAEERKIGLTVVGPEAPLVGGLADRFAARGLAVFGPRKNAARIEGSKAWSKALLLRHGIPTAWGVTFRNAQAAKEYIWAQNKPLVVKADGLAAGKGVVVADTTDEALMAINEIMEERVFGAAGDCVVIEERLSGLEVSVLALTDGETVLPLAPACDYKRVRDGDEGPNTGGMGAYSPAGFVTATLWEEVEERILLPTVRAMAAEGNPYQGVLYAGLMITPYGAKVLEFNCRFGDPETQVILPRLKSDLVPLALATMQGRLSGLPVEWDERLCCGVVLAAGGYPGAYQKGLPITGLDRVPSDVLVFHAGTARDGEHVVTSGGRVLTAVGLGETMAGAREAAYRGAAAISFEGCHYRRDIALREVR